MKITLSAWASRNFDPAPSIATLRAWAKSGQIVPAPMKIGRDWRVEENAVYRRLETPDGGSLSERAKAILSVA